MDDEVKLLREQIAQLEEEARFREAELQALRDRHAMDDEEKKWLRSMVEMALSKE